MRHAIGKGGFIVFASYVNYICKDKAHTCIEQRSLSTVHNFVDVASPLETRMTPAL